MTDRIAAADGNAATDGEADRGAIGPGAKPPLVFLVNVDWFFCSHFLHLARRARADGWPVIIATHFESRRDLLTKEGFTLLPLDARRAGTRPRGLAHSVATLRQFLAAHPGAVLHGFGLFGILVGSLAGRLAGERRAVYTITGRGISAVEAGARASALRLATRLVCRRLADGQQTRWLAENRTDLEETGLSNALAGGRARIVGGAGVDPAAFPLMPMPAGPPLRCALVARAIWSKGLDIAVQAIELARAAGTDIELTLVGAPDPANPRSYDTATLEGFARRPGVRWLGRLDDVAGLWRQHHVGLLPSRGGEGVPKALLEAAACGRPIVTTDVPGCREFAAATGGWSVPAGDAEALAAALMAAARPPVTALAEKGAAARRSILESYTEAAVWTTVSQIYAELSPASERRHS